MAHVIFYAKPGCKGNARQMQVLRSAGWEPERLEAWIGLGSAMSPGKEGCASGGAKRPLL